MYRVFISAIYIVSLRCLLHEEVNYIKYSYTNVIVYQGYTDHDISVPLHI